MILVHLKPNVDKHQLRGGGRLDMAVGFRTAIVLAIGAAMYLPILPGSSAAAAATTATFEFSGAPQDFTVPAGICRVTITSFGAQGGGLGGRGARATASVAVRPADTLRVNVGGQGALGALQFGGGSNGGGNGRYGGGGASDVRLGGSDITHRIVVAAGGGGGEHPRRGGAGGGAEGEPGDGPTGGGGANDKAGGRGGIRGDFPWLSPAGGGENGALGKGGNGGQGFAIAFPFNGGGGGGGYYGGGGGGAPDGAGGGGSSFGPAGASFEAGVREGDGSVTIAYDPTTDACPTVPSDDPKVVTTTTLAPADDGGSTPTTSVAPPTEVLDEKVDAPVDHGVIPRTGTGIAEITLLGFAMVAGGWSMRRRFAR